VFTVADAKTALNVPAAVQNNNCVQDAQWRLRAALDLAAPYYADADPAPDYVLQALAGLESWIAAAS